MRTRVSHIITLEKAVMDKFSPMISLEEAFRLFDTALAGRILPGEFVPVREAQGRVLVHDVQSLVDCPAFDKSAVDGFALLADEGQQRYTLLETIPAGYVGSAQLLPGTTVKVMTGAPVPAGTARVVKLEQAREDHGQVEVLREESKANICKQGEDVRTGDTILPAGTVLGALEIANLVGVGISALEVRRRPRVAIISTGDEIVDDPALLAPGKIMNSNGPLLAGLSQEHGLHVVSERAIPDEREATLQAISEAMSQTDIVLLTGGVSVGECDYILPAFAELGLTLHFTRLLVQPGKPTVFATGREQVVFGLPGNPVAAYLMFHLFVLRALALLNARAPEPREYCLPLVADFSRRKTERQAFLPARLNHNGALEILPYHGSAHLQALIAADGFFSVPADCEHIAAGERVTFLPVSRGERCW